MTPTAAPRFVFNFAQTVPHRRAQTAAMATILPYIQDDAFQPDDVKAMSMALDDLCKELKLDGNANAKETIAVRIIELARCGERSPTKLRDRVLREANDLIA
jgi:hypothetical protein